ncbi:MAG: hypothetical protein ACRCTZ_16820 [Sarcina sp.]
MENNDYGYIKEHPRSADFRREGLRRLKGNFYNFVKRQAEEKN